MGSHLDDIIKYCDSVLSGSILANRYVKAQCRLFLNDFKTRQHEEGFPYWFSEDNIDHVIGYIQLLTYVDGAVAGQRIKLEPWQKFILGSAYGWVRKDDPRVRRYTRILTMVARKNAKSTLLAAWGLYELMFAPEGSQIVSMATQREQARLVWSASERMAQTADPRLVEGFHSTVSTMSNRNLWNRYTPLSKESKRLDGLNIRMAIVDEAAAIQDQNLFEVVESSMGAQLSPQTVYITTGQAGAESGYFYSLLGYAKKVLDGVVEDERIFCLAYAVEDGDMWNDPRVWIKANPNLGVSVSEAFLREEAKQAEEMTSKRANFRTKYLNEFISTSHSWLPLSQWEKNSVAQVKADKLRQGKLFIGLDLGATGDLTAVSSIFKLGNEYLFEAKCFVPEQAFKDAPRHVRQVYVAGVESGSLIITEGEVSDHETIKAYILELSGRYDLVEVAFDGWSAVRLVSGLQEEGLSLVRVDQNMKSLSPASKESEMLIKSGKLLHTGDQFINWQLSNAEMYVDVNGNIKIRKGKDPALKVDAIIAMIMAMARATMAAEVKPKSFGFYIA